MEEKEEEEKRPEDGFKEKRVQIVGTSLSGFRGLGIASIQFYADHLTTLTKSGN